MVRLLRQADVVLPAWPWRDHTRLAKKRARAIEYSRGNNRQRLYRELLAKTRATLAYLHDAMARLADDPAPVAAAWRAEAEHFVPLIERIIDQTERRVLHGEKVPAADKLDSLFEPHSDIIVKSRRQVSYGHKLNLASGASGLILDIVVEQGNPADAERFVPMVDRQIAIYGRPPRQLAADGGCASTWQPLTVEHMTDMTFVPFLAAPGDVMFFDSLVPHLGRRSARALLPRQAPELSARLRARHRQARTSSASERISSSIGSGPLPDKRGGSGRGAAQERPAQQQTAGDPGDFADAADQGDRQGQGRRAGDGTADQKKSDPPARRSAAARRTARCAPAWRPMPDDPRHPGYAIGWPRNRKA